MFGKNRQHYLFLPRQTIGLFLKTLIAIIVSFSAAIVVNSFIIRPTTRESGIVVHLSAELLQDMMNVKLRGQSYEAIASYLSTRGDAFLGQAQIATVSELFQRETSHKYGIELKGNERGRLLAGRAFTTGTWTKQGDILPIMKAAQRAGREYRDSERRDGISQMDYRLLIQYTRGVMHSRAGKWNRWHQENRTPFIVIPIADTQYVVFAHRPLPLSPTVPTQSLILGMIAALFILSLAALVIIMPMVLRIRRIQTVCHRVTTGDYSARCHDTRRDSLGALANNVDEMTCAIERHLTQQKSLLQAVSHELRTPLARIRFAIAMIDVADDDEKGLERIESIDEDLDEIDSMLKELSFFNYVDAGKGSDHFEEVSVPEMLQATLKQRSQPLESFDVQIVGDLAGLTVTVDPTAFKRVIGNLLGNAARYAKETIVVRVQKVTIGNQLMLEVAVEDDGPGIPEDKWQEVFEPFVCLDPSRSKSVGGVGLGLAICDRIMKIHRGVIKVEHAPGGGARMVTQWPIFQV